MKNIYLISYKYKAVLKDGNTDIDDGYIYLAYDELTRCNIEDAKKCIIASITEKYDDIEKVDNVIPINIIRLDETIKE